jgi:hypothetical protein
MEKIKLSFIDSDLYPLRQVWIYMFKIWLMNLELTLSKILTVLNIVIGMMMMTFDDFNDILFWWFIEC